jgi:uracil-DNA glycosylase
MRMSARVRCREFPCTDVNHAGYSVPGIDIDPQAVRVILISEASPPEKRDHYYARGDPLFARTTLQAFADAGIRAESLDDLIERGLYFTTAVKCGKTRYALARPTIEACSSLLERELGLFSQARVLLLMGDVAIASLNAISRRQGTGRVIPAGSTYKMRGSTFAFHGMRVFPSYLQAGPSFFIEKSKRKMIAEDIRRAMRLIA